MIRALAIFLSGVLVAATCAVSLHPRLSCDGGTLPRGGVWAVCR